MKKSQLLEAIQDMPDDVSIDELMERLIVTQKIERGQQQVKEGKVYSEIEAKKKLGKWLK